jgi:hypothetical protein
MLEAITLPRNLRNTENAGMTPGQDARTRLGGGQLLEQATISAQSVESALVASQYFLFKD